MKSSVNSQFLLEIRITFITFLKELTRKIATLNCQKMQVIPTWLLSLVINVKLSFAEVDGMILMRSTVHSCHHPVCKVLFCGLRLCKASRWFGISVRCQQRSWLMMKGRKCGVVVSKQVVILQVCWIISQTTEENFPERYLYWEEKETRQLQQVRGSIFPKAWLNQILFTYAMFIMMDINI